MMPASAVPVSRTPLPVVLIKRENNVQLSFGVLSCLFRMILDPLIYQVDLLYMLETMHILHHQRTPIQGSLMVEIQETLRHPFLFIPRYQQ